MLDQLRRRELGFSDFINVSLKLYGKNLKRIFLIVLLVHIPLSVLMLGALREIIQIDPYGMLNGNWYLLLNMIPFMFLSMVFYCFNLMAITFIIWKSVHNEDVKFRDLIRLFVNKIFSSIWISILVTVVILGWVAVPIILTVGAAMLELRGINLVVNLIIIPILFYWIYSYMFSQQALIIEGQRGMAALRYSRDLVRGKWWKILLFTIGAYLLRAIAGWFILAIVDSMTPNTIWGGIIDAGAVQLLESFVIVAITVLFINLNFVYNKRDHIINPSAMNSTL